MFTKRHEQELAEIKALTYELGERFEQVLEELESIKTAQDQLAARGQLPTTAGADTAGPVEPAAAAGAKRARRAQSATPVAVAAGAKGGKRQGKGATRSASDSPRQSTKRAKSAVAGDAPEGSGGRKRGGGRKRRQPAEPAASPGSEE